MKQLRHCLLRLYLEILLDQHLLERLAHHLQENLLGHRLFHHHQQQLLYLN
jgi:hypothetical protein